eukprot:SAG22_NODE_3160_length_1892_cov_2.140547_1_plen_454_part_10
MMKPEPAEGPGAAPASQAGAPATTVTGYQLEVQPVLIAGLHPSAAAACSAPCAMQWCGGCIIQSAGFGFLSVATIVAWPIGMVFAYAYAAGLILTARCMEQSVAKAAATDGELGRTASRIDSSVAATGRSMLYAFAMAFVFIGGCYIPVNVIGDGTDTASVFTGGGGGLDPSFPIDLPSVLPAGTSASLAQWAGSTCPTSGDFFDSQRPTLAVFGGETFVSAKTGGAPSSAWCSDGSGGSPLVKIDAGGTIAAVGGGAVDAYAFAEYGGQLYFSAASDAVGRELWRVAPGGSSPAVAVTDIRPGGEHSGVGALVIDGTSLFFRASTTDAARAATGWWATVWEHNASGTYELLPTAAAADGSTVVAPAAVDDDPETVVLESTEVTPIVTGGSGELWGMLLMAALPHLLGSALLFAKTEASGLMSNLFAGGAAVVLLLFAIISDETNITGFAKVFF